MLVCTSSREAGRQGAGGQVTGREAGRQAGRQAGNTHTHTHTHAGVKTEEGDASWRMEAANTSLDTFRATVSGLRVFLMCS